MRSPQHWPCWPFLPLTRVKDGVRSTAVLADTQAGLMVVEDANVYMLSDALSDPSRIRPADPEALVDDGWRVD